MDMIGNRPLEGGERKPGSGTVEAREELDRLVVAKAIGSDGYFETVEDALDAYRRRRA